MAPDPLDIGKELKLPFIKDGSWNDSAQISWGKNTKISLPVLSAYRKGLYISIDDPFMPESNT